MECQVERNEQFRHHLYGFSRGSKASEVTRNISSVCAEDSIAERTAPKWFARFKQGNFDVSDTPLSGRTWCTSGGIWRGLSIMNCLRGTWPSLLKATVKNFAVWRKQSSKNARVDDMDWFFIMTTPTTHCKHDKSGHSGDSSISALLSRPSIHRITTSSSLSPTICSARGFFQQRRWTPKLARRFLHGQTDGFLQGWDRKPARTLGSIHE
jgi:hypothetical protein